MQPTRLLLAAAALLGLAAFTDSGNHFTIDFPEGWSAPAADADGNVQSDAPAAAGKAWCRANSNAMPDLTATQDQINTVYSSPWDLATWASVLSVDPSKMQIAEGEARIVDGHVVQVVTMTLAPDLMGAEAKARFVSHVMTGRMVNAGCFSPSEAYDGMKTLFETVVSSLKPI